MLGVRISRPAPRIGREPLIGALIGTACAVAVLLFAPPAQDLAAHAYRASLVSHGVLLWDNYWYTGTYPLVTYSLLAPALSAVIGLAVFVVACTAAAGALFASIATREWGRDARWPSRAFAAAAALPLLPGLDAYVLGVPLLLASIASLQRGRRVARARLRRIDARGEPARLRVPARHRRGGRPLRSGRLADASPSWAADSRCSPHARRS